ncbi:hypothetical protein KB206_14055 [Microvirga sp. STS02]|uniref:hypothetical protein n=1 Tax=Hymenobacter negativus TaxID=2795026 RepID=UPI0018DD7ADD|nr:MULTISPECIES: hypothetical protein [Bacteria]MBH8570011.1 hypothetical protein [Hymenobacter negativus]MBR7209750.1 hypothetical protein [Microvirga sp. STS02]
MILHGILGKAFERTCIRGFARLSDLAKTSWADYDYQRDFDAEQIGYMLDYLESGEAFFPEVILSYKEPPAQAQLGGVSIVSQIRGDAQQVAAKSWRAVQADGPSFSMSRHSQPKAQKPDARVDNENSTVLVTIQIDEGALVPEDVPIDRNNPGRPFFRIDGNHRLIAGSKHSANGGGEFDVPFCLLLLPNSDDYLTIERLIFSNINSKSLPLTQEQLILAGISDADIITEDRIQYTPYGPAYLLVRNTFEACLKHRETIHHWNASILLLDRETSSEPPVRILGHLRTVLKQAYELLLEAGEHDKRTLKDEKLRDGIANAEKFDDYPRMVRALLRTKQLYDESPQLKYSKSIGLIAAFVRYAFLEDEFSLQRFRDWALNNHLDELPSIQAHDAVAIFERIRHSRSRTIFVSMPFDGSCDAHFKMIEQVVKSINATHTPKHRDLFIKPVRVDRLIEGKTQKISDAIFHEIQQSGMLIADLTGKNANVYHEVGYLMGLAKHTNQPTPNLLFICNTSTTKVPQDIGFNLRDYSIITFQDTIDLAPELTKHISACYATGDARRPEPPDDKEKSVESEAGTDSEN